MADIQYPKGILPVLPVADVDGTVDYYISTLGFSEAFRQPGSNGSSIDAQLRFEESSLMLNHNPKDADREGGGIYLWIRLFETDVDEYYQQLKDGGVEIVEEIKDQFWGDRSFVIKDRNQYHLAFNQAVKK